MEAPRKQPPIAPVDSDTAVPKEEPWTIRGRVFQPDGVTGAAGVPVFAVYRPRFINSSNVLAQAMTDREGRYELTGVFNDSSTETLYVLASGGGWISREVEEKLVRGRHSSSEISSVKVQAGESFTLDLHVVPCARIEGRVLSPNGEPVPGAIVRGRKMTIPPLLAMSRRLAAEDVMAPVQTDGDGRFVIWAPVGRSSIRLEAMAPGFCLVQSDALESSMGEVTSVDLELVTPRSLTLTVLDESDDSAIVGAFVYAEYRRSGSFVNSNNTYRRVPRSGRVEVAPLLMQPVRIRVVDDRYLEYRTNAKEDACGDWFQSVPGKTHHYEGVVRLEPLCPIHGTVVWPKSIDLSGAQLSVSAKALDAPGYEHYRGFAEVDAIKRTFTIYVPKRGTFALEATQFFHEDRLHCDEVVVTAASENVRVAYRILSDDEIVLEPEEVEDDGK